MLVKKINSYESRLDLWKWHLIRICLVHTISGFEVEYTNFNTTTRKCRGTISGYKSA